MLRKIITIDKDKCNGCGLCTEACHENAIGMIDGKAKLLRDDYCDGLGDCLPACPVDAIHFEVREALPYNEIEVKRNMKDAEEKFPCGCPGSNAKSLIRENSDLPSPSATKPVLQSQLNQWPVQIKLVPVNAPYFENAALLIAADCSAYAHGNFHNDFMYNKITLIGCPKLDEGDYSEKLTQIIKKNEIKSITVVRMEVPCCGGIENAVKQALHSSGKMIPWQIVTLSVVGDIISE